MIHVANHPEKYSADERYKCGTDLINVLIKTCDIKVEAYGLENIPKKNGFYLCANHQEKFDPLAIWQTFPGQIGVILDDKATHRPFISEICKLIKSQKLIRKDVRSTIQKINDITIDLKNGDNYMVFPEGYYEKDFSTLETFRAGSFKSPKRAHCPIVPVCIVDSYRVFDDGYKTKNPIQVHYLEPIMPEQFENLSTQELAEMVRQKIQAALDTFQK